MPLINPAWLPESDHRCWNCGSSAGKETIPVMPKAWPTKIAAIIPPADVEIRNRVIHIRVLGRG
jgi:hypothetical protein